MIWWIILTVYLIGAVITYPIAYRAWTTEFPDSTIKSTDFTNWFASVFWSWLAATVWFVGMPLYLMWWYAGKDRK